MTDASVDDPLLTRREAAEFLGLRPSTLAAWQTTGRYGLRAIKIGRLCRYRLSALRAWLAEREREAGCDTTRQSSVPHP